MGSAQHSLQAFSFIGQHVFSPGINSFMVPDCNFQLQYSGSQTPAHFVPLHPSPEEIGGKLTQSET